MARSRYNVFKGRSKTDVPLGQKYLQWRIPVLIASDQYIFVLDIYLTFTLYNTAVFIPNFSYFPHNKNSMT